MDEPTIRQATEADAEAVWNITLRAWSGYAIGERLEQRHGVVDGRPWREHMARAVAGQIKNKNATTFVAELEGRVVGYAMAQMETERPTETGTVSYNAVDPDFRRRGIGRALVTHVVKFLKERGARVLTVITLEPDVPARRIYEGLGFKELTRLVYYSMD